MRGGLLQIVIGVAAHRNAVVQIGEPAAEAAGEQPADSDEEVEVVRRFCTDRGVEFAVADHFARGGEGAVELAQAVVELDGDEMTRIIWQFIKDQGFMGMIIPREHGGLGFSAAAQSAVIARLSSRCVTAAVTVMVHAMALGPLDDVAHPARRADVRVLEHRVEGQEQGTDHAAHQ